MIAVAYFEQIESARTPTDLFVDPDRARSVYRRLARQVHPDTNSNDPRAHAAFERLGDLWDQYNGKTHGRRAPAAPGAPKASIFETKRNVFIMGDLIARGDVSNVYSVTYQLADGDHTTAALKMPRSPKNNDLVVNEIENLKLLKEKVPEKYQMFHPTTVDSFVHKDTAGKTRRCLVVDDLTGFVSLSDVFSAYPDGISPRHVAWIARRLWVAIEEAHKAGLVHGAVFPEHVMIHPEMHGVILIDWSYARPKGETLVTAVPKYLTQGWYGEKYKLPLDHRLDVRQASHTLEKLLGEQEARPFRAFFNGCRVASAPTAGQLFQEFDDLLERVYGRRKFVPFEMPKGWVRSV